MSNKITIRRRLATYSRLRGTSWVALKQAQKSTKDRFYNCLIVMLFTAFSLEAYLNHLGASELEYWTALKRKLSPREKLEVLSKAMGFEVDYGRRPFQTFGEVFRFRNSLVHAETEYLSVEALEASESIPLAKWEEKVTLETARRFHRDAKAMMVQLHSCSGIVEEPLFDTDIISAEARRTE